MIGSTEAASNVPDVVPGLIRALSERPVGPSDAARIDRIRLLEELKSAAAAAQTREIAAFVDSQRAVARTTGVRAERCEQGVASQLGLAMRCSPTRARRHVGWAKIHHELPETFAQLQAGKTTEWRAMLMARETGWLSREHRAQVDAEIGPRLEQLGDKGVVNAAKKLAYRLDPVGYLNRIRGAEGDRHVSIRPAPDLMCRLSALLPVRDGVASHAALSREAAALKAAGDRRSKSQLMADLLIERLTGRSVADGVPVEVNLTMSAETLLDSEPAEEASAAAEPAYLDGYGPIPAPVARKWLLDPDRIAPVWLRRLFTLPGSGQLIAMESRRRLFTPAQARFIRIRDQVCRTPWCEAPIRHIDHVRPAEAGGPTSTSNAQGTCEACNYAKAAPGWQARPGPGGIVITRTPTGHRYTSRPPDLPSTPPARARSPVEQRLADLIYHHAA